MQLITPEAYYTAYKNADKKIINLVDSTEIYERAESLIAKQSQRVDPSDIVLPTAYFLLNLILIDELVKEFEKIGVEDAIYFLADLKKSLDAYVVEVDLLEEASTIEQDLATLRNIRTMSSDIEAIKTDTEIIHQSSQADILRPDVAPQQATDTSPRRETT